jgi:hypothetical protein
MTGLDLVVMLFLSGLASGWFTAVVMRARADVGESHWHAHMEGKRIVVRRYTGTLYTNGNRRYDEAWSKAFNPADVDSRSAALAEAEDVMTGMRDLDRRLRQLRASP